MEVAAERDATVVSIGRNGASEGIRTLDTHVGNVMLYQAELRSLPKARKNYGNPTGMQALFLPLLLGYYRKGHGGQDTYEGSDVIPANLFVQISHGEDAKHHKGDDFLDNF